jgi:hypothetical protein
MTYLEFRKLVLKLLNKFSARGTELNVTKTADIRLKVQDFINAELMDIASTTGKLAAKKTYVQKPVCNEIAKDTSSIKQHIPGTDFAVSLAGAKAYFFEATGPATITIDEYVSGAWVNLETITIASTVTDFTEHKGLITASSTANTVRINFSGSYIYTFRNYILYPYTFPSDATVQQHRPRFIYTLPTDFLKINNVCIRKDTRQEVAETNFILDLKNKTISFLRTTEGEFILNYWRKPTYITITGVDATDDAQTIDAVDEAVYILAYGVASIVVAKSDSATSAYLNNLYEAKKSNITGTDGVYVQAQVPLVGW